MAQVSLLLLDGPPFVFFESSYLIVLVLLVVILLLGREIVNKFQYKSLYDNSFMRKFVGFSYSRSLNTLFRRKFKDSFDCVVGSFTLLCFLFPMSKFLSVAVR